MKNQNFLKKASKEGKLELAEPSQEICQSYLEKAKNRLKSAESFVLEMKTEIEKLDQEEIESLRTKLNKIIQK